MITFFSFFFATNFRTCRTRSFISITETDGQCDPVAKPVTGDFLLATTGAWVGSSDTNNTFLYSEVSCDLLLTYQLSLILSSHPAGYIHLLV